MMQILSRCHRLSLLALSCAALAACGGGGSDASTSDTPVLAAGFASGAITGFGSIIVNGVHFDESKAAIRDDDGASSNAEALKLGMVVEIASSSAATAASDGTLRATATELQYRSEIEGPVTAIDLTARTLSVLGQTLQIKDTTVFEDELRGGLSTVKIGDRIEVYGFLSASGQYTATRIELEDADDSEAYKLRGLVSALDTTQQRFQLGGITVSYAGLSTPAGLANGALVRVELQRTTDAAGLWIATRLSSAVTSGSVSASQGLQAEIEGHITAMESATRFQVDGITVDAASATRVPSGLAVGQMVDVEGLLLNGVLTASSVELEQRLEADDGFEIEGSIGSVDAAGSSFTLRGVTVNHANARFDQGSAAQLKVGVKVEVKGQLASDGVTLVASEVEFDD
jgi:Domain of unknown function (DUF5666)